MMTRITARYANLSIRGQTLLSFSLAASCAIVSSGFLLYLGRGVESKLLVAAFVGVAVLTLLIHAAIAGALARSVSRLRAGYDSEKSIALLRNASDGIHILDTDGNLIEFSDSFCKMLGYSREQMQGMNVAQWDANFAADELMLRIGVQFALQSRSQFETRHRCSDGTVIDVEISGLPLELDGRPVLFNSSRDISCRKHAEAELRVAACAFETQEGMLITDASSKILRVNQAFTLITGYSAEEVIGKTPAMFRSGRQDDGFYEQMWRSIHNLGGWKGEIWNKRKNGEIFPELLAITAVKDADGKVVNYVASLTDITISKAASEEIRSLAFYDPLTLLPNRRLLLDRLGQALTGCARSGKRGALLFLDLDNFKRLNDTLGHDVGDLLLQQVACRLSSCVREGDTVARLGGDEFVVMLEDLSSQNWEAAAQTKTIGEKILSALNLPYMLACHEYSSTPSIGATLFGEQQQSIEGVLKHADMAMYQAKNAGRNALRFFDPEMQSLIAERVALEKSLSEAVAGDQLFLHYQAQVAGDGEIAGAEALMRWRHPEVGMVPPGSFIPLAEEAGLILQLGDWVLHQACAQLAAWASDPELAHLTIAVNISACQFHQDDFVTRVLDALERSGADPKRLKLELTESMLISDIDGVAAKMAALKARGVGFALDDFGTGYSSLAYLSRLPLDQLKIDRSFVADIEFNENAVVICAATISLAHSLKLTVVAEGVETGAQSHILSAVHNCDFRQGYLFSEPVPLDEFDALVRNRRTRERA